MPLLITTDSHLDHNLTPDAIAYIGNLFQDKNAFFIETIELPERLGKFPCNMHGPIVGEPDVQDSEAFYEKRGDRAWQSRMCKRPPTMTNKLTIIGGPHEDKPCIMYTAYAGPSAPKELMDTSLSPVEVDATREFWSKHALGK